MTRRYGWRAVLKAMKVEGTHKESEVEIKILPVHKLGKAKQVNWPFFLERSCAVVYALIFSWGTRHRRSCTMYGIRTTMSRSIYLALGAPTLLLANALSAVRLVISLNMGGSDGGELPCKKPIG